MTTFDYITLKCPHCTSLMSAYELMSYTVHQSVSWSDGKTDHGAPNMDQICICASCREIFWKGDARISLDDGHEPQKDIPDVMDMHDLDWKFDDDRDVKTIDFYKKLLDRGFAATDEKEYYVRNRIWWAINDLIRYNADIRSARNLGMFCAIINHRRRSHRLFKSYLVLQQENLRFLAKIYSGSPDVDQLYLANMYREGGMFSEASEVIQGIDRKDKLWKQLLSKIRRRNSRVFEIK